MARDTHPIPTQHPHTQARKDTTQFNTRSGTGPAKNQIKAHPHNKDTERPRHSKHRLIKRQAPRGKPKPTPTTHQATALCVLPWPRQRTRPTRMSICVQSADYAFCRFSGKPNCQSFTMYTTTTHVHSASGHCRQPAPRVMPGPHTRRQ